MAKSKDDIKYGTSQARLSEDEAVRLAYVHGTPLEGGKIADSEPVNMFSSAHNISKARTDQSDSNQSQLQREDDADKVVCYRLQHWCSSLAQERGTIK